MVGVGVSEKLAANVVRVATHQGTEPDRPFIQVSVWRDVPDDIDELIFFLSIF